jgi:hypothetical protein
MPEEREYTVSQTRKVKVTVKPESNESYEQAALRVAHRAFENPGEPDEGMGFGVHGMPKIVSTTIHRDDMLLEG